MAYTVSRKATVWGDMGVVVCDVTADAASGTIPTGLSRIYGYSLGPQSMGTAAIKMAAATGTVTVSNAVNGDAFYLTVYGAR